MICEQAGRDSMATKQHEYSVVYSPQSKSLGGMYDWEVWRDDEFLGGCPSEEDAALLVGALNDRRDKSGPLAMNNVTFPSWRH